MTELNFLIVLKTRHPRSRCQQGWSLVSPLSAVHSRLLCVLAGPFLVSTHAESKLSSLLLGTLTLLTLLDQGSTVTSSLNLNHPYKDPFSKISHIGDRGLNMNLVVAGAQTFRSYHLPILTSQITWEKQEAKIFRRTVFSSALLSQCCLLTALQLVYKKRAHSPEWLPHSPALPPATQVRKL